MKLSESEIEQAIVEYLSVRGITGIKTSQVKITHQRICAGDVYEAAVSLIELQRKEPYR